MLEDDDGLLIQRLGPGVLALSVQGSCQQKQVEGQREGQRFECLAAHLEAALEQISGLHDLALIKKDVTEFFQVGGNFGVLGRQQALTHL